MCAKHAVPSIIILLKQLAEVCCNSLGYFVSLSSLLNDY